ncbi:MAG: hypothetical protein HC904_11455 [Blastochloris sp.]|nr:hypothetical protein [Blastochloris sp.]
MLFQSEQSHRTQAGRWQCLEGQVDKTPIFLLLLRGLRGARQEALDFRLTEEAELGSVHVQPELVAKKTTGQFAEVARF